VNKRERERKKNKRQKVSRFPSYSNLGLQAVSLVILNGKLGVVSKFATTHLLSNFRINEVDILQITPSATSCPLVAITCE